MREIQEDYFLDLLKQKKLKELREELISLEAPDIAEFIEKIGEIETLAVFRLLPKDISAEVFAYFDVDMQEHLLNSMTNVELTEIVDKLYIDDVVDLFEELPANIVKKVMRGIETEKRGIINQYLQYPEESAGSIMTAEFIDIKKHYTVGMALNKIREKGMTSETIYTLYITDDQRKLEGFLSVRTILVNREEALISDLMDENVIYTHTLEDQEEVAKLFSKYGFLAIPVVDNEKRLVGVVTVDDAVDVIQEEATEDFEIMAGMTPSEKPYLKTPSLVLAKNRLVWLVVLLLTATITGAIINYFEESVLTKVAGIIAFIPMLTGAGGNAGSQSSTMIIRGLSLNEIEVSDYFRVLIKEVLVGLVVGGGLSIINFIRMIVFKEDIKVALAVSVSLLCTVVIAKAAGGILPLIAKKFNTDPAVMAAPLITTIVDSLSLLIYVMFVAVILL